MANDLLKAYQGMKSGPSMNLYRYITQKENQLEEKKKNRRNQAISMLTKGARNVEKKYSDWKKTKKLVENMDDPTTAKTLDGLGGFMHYLKNSGEGGRYRHAHTDPSVANMETTSITRDAYTKLRDFSQKGRQTEKEREEKLKDYHLENVNKRKSKEKNEFSRELLSEKARLDSSLNKNRGKGVNIFKEGWGALKGELLTEEKRPKEVFSPFSYDKEKEREGYEHGGMVKGKDHDQGGVKIEVEGGEFIFPEDVVRKVGVGFFNRLLKMLKGGRS